MDTPLCTYLDVGCNIVQVGIKTFSDSSKDLRGDDLERRVEPSRSALYPVRGNRRQAHVVCDPESHFRVVVLGGQKAKLVVVDLAQVFAMNMGVFEGSLP